MDDLDLGATLKGFTPGQRVFGRYTLARVLGRGGMGVVWLARDDELGREVALKFLPEVVANDRASVEEMKREVRRAIDLAHPHIIKTNDFVTDGRMAAVSMEYAPGGTLSSVRLDEPGQVFTPDRLAPWVKQLAVALDYAHEHAEVVHRDLKPSNLMLDAKGRLKIVDFGIAASISESVSRVSKQAGSSGTPVYMSPQQMMGEPPARTDDLYAVGATLFELLTGKPPFHAGNILLQVQNKPAPPVNERRRTLGLEPVPAEWEAAIAACLAKSPGERPQSGADLLALVGLDATTGRKATPVPPPPAPPPAAVPAPVASPAPPAPARARSSRAGWATRAALIVGVAVAVMILLGDPEAGVDVAVMFGLISTLVSWLPLLGLHVLVVRPESTAEELAAEHARREARRVLRRQRNREARAALAGSLPPYLLFAGWVWSRASDYTVAGEELVLAVALLFGWVLVSGFYLVVQKAVVGGDDRKLGPVIGVMAAIGALLGLLVWSSGFALPFELVLTGADLVRGVVASATLWALAGLISHYLVRGPTTIDARLLPFAGVVGGVLLVHALYFALVGLPDIIQAEDNRRAEIRQRQEEEARREAEKARLEEEKRLAEVRERALGRVRAAYSHVFDRRPSAESEEEFVRQTVANPAWSDADLRRALRASPEGAKGGRLLVPQEFPRIGDAIREASPGNVVVIGPGTYAESLVVDKDVDLIGPGQGRAVVQGPHDRNVLRVRKTKGVVVRGLTFRHTDTADLERRTWLVSINEADVAFESNEVANGNGDGIGIDGPGRVVVRGNHIHGNRWSGLSTWKSVDVEIADNRIRSNGQSGISVREAAARVAIRRNDLATNEGNGINVSNSSGVTIEGNTVTRTAKKLTAVWWDTAQGSPRFGSGNTVDGQPLRTDAPN